MKIYTDDPRVSYKGTTINPERTREEISALLREYDTGDIWWHWKPDANDIYVNFIIEEVIDGIPVRVAAKVVCPVIWAKASRNARTPERRIEQPNLQVSMRAMYWYIKTHLETSYAMQSSRVAAFLSDMVIPNGGRFFDQIKSRLDQFKALENKVESAQRDVEVIKPPPRNITKEPLTPNES